MTWHKSQNGDRCQPRLEFSGPRVSFVTPDDTFCGCDVTKLTTRHSSGAQICPKGKPTSPRKNFIVTSHTQNFLQPLAWNNELLLVFFPKTISIKMLNYYRDKINETKLLFLSFYCVFIKVMLRGFQQIARNFANLLLLLTHQSLFCSFLR
jgi:hypothetical protein